MNEEMRLHIILEKPPADVSFALQSGSGSKFEIVQRQLSGTDNLLFALSVKIKRDKDGQPDFTGPFVQGNKGERFIYVGSGRFAGDTDSCWDRRLKIPLRGIARSVIDKVMAGNDLVLETRVPGTGRDGGPNCATVKPFDGWSVAKVN